MPTKTSRRSHFVTSVHTSVTAAARTAPDLLGRHLTTCLGREPLLSRLRRAAQALDRLAAPRFVTSLVVFAGALALLSAVL